MRKTPHLLLVILIIICSTVISHAQFSTNDETRMVVVTQEDKNIHADVLREDYLFIPKSEIIYYCYYQGKIEAIQGSYTGLLLTGFYEEFSIDNKLLQQGHFYHGMKHGRWKEWQESGKLKKIEFWDKGKLSGAFQEFDEEGKEMKRGNYKNNKITGKLTIIQDGEVKEEKHYKDGKEVEKQDLSSVFKKREKKEEKGDTQRKNNRSQNPEKSDEKKERKEKWEIFKKKDKKKEEKSSSKTKKSKEGRPRSTNYVPDNNERKETPLKVNQKPKAPKTVKNNDKYKKYFSRSFPF